MLAQGRAALREGNLNGARQALKRHRSRFPGGRLLQEREALAIEVLWQSGQQGSARQRAEAFVRAHPESPHAARLQALVGNRP